MAERYRKSEVYQIDQPAEVDAENFMASFFLFVLTEKEITPVENQKAAFSLIHGYLVSIKMKTH